MAYNVLTGSIFRIPTGSLKITGSFAGDAGNLTNLPIDNITNAADNRLVTFTSVAGQTLNGEANLTFNGSALSITGEVTASIGVKANFFEGDGSRLTGITGTGAGIFTEVNSSNAYTTSSVKIGASGTPAANLHVSGTTYLSGGVAFRRVAVTANYTASTNEFFLGVDTSAARSILLDATQFTNGQMIVIKDEIGSASVNNITLTASGSQTIDVDYASVAIESPFGAVNLYSDTANWFIF